MESNRKSTELNRVADDLRCRIKRHTFASLRALFLQHIVARHAPQSLAEAARIVTDFPSRPGDPSDADIESLRDQKLVLLLEALKTTTIHKLRNDVVHKWAYRPTRQEVAYAIDETRSILFLLATYFNLHDEINRYSSTQ